MSDDDYRAALNDALAAEVWAEMGRSGLRTIPKLAEASGLAPTALQDRLNQNSRTKKRTTITTVDLVRIGLALDVNPADLLRRAMATVGPPPAATHQADVG